ncbi:unnamed protein product [Ilex paraguariensis]|uniref:Formin-like protein n=1 Tax=Ilex paraguariensis TaxID=185542 RepID=A0ABC8QTQ0_9AQUA
MTRLLHLIAAVVSAMIMLELPMGFQSCKDLHKTAQSFSILSGVEGHGPRNGRSSGGGDHGNPRKLDSPELRPLPPLSGRSFRRNYGNARVGEEEDDEFYSPKGSLTGRESSIGTGSASRRVFAAVVVENFSRSDGSSSSLYSSSSFGSPVRSVSLSISPPVSLSPKSSRPKSPELAPVRTAPPPPVSPFVGLLVNRKESASQSPSSSSSPLRDLGKSQYSSPRLSDVSNKHSHSPLGDLRKSQESPLRISNSSSQPNSHSPARVSSIEQNVRVPVPAPPSPALSIPPPPPLPPFRHWESPTTPTPLVPEQISKPPVLVTPLKPIAIQSPTLISPMELPLNSEDVMKKVIVGNSEEATKPKLKPLHWDKVRASSDREMVWDQLKSSSFKYDTQLSVNLVKVIIQLNEEMIETLFIVNTPISNPKETTRRQVLPSPPASQENRVLDPKKSQNIAIRLRALNVTIEEVCEALLDGNVDALGMDFLESLLKMAPTKEEERKLKEYKEDSPFTPGPAERFLKAVLDIPFAFKRVDAMLYMSNFEFEVEYLKKSFETLEAACEELRNSRMFLKLLEAVLKTGNRMNVGTNRGDAHAFKLDTLLKLVDVKGVDGKTTLLHFVVQEITRSEGARLATPNQNPTSTVNDDVKCRKLGLQVVSGLCMELVNVKKAAAMDSEVLNYDVLKLSNGIGNIAEVARLNKAMGLEESSMKFSESMNRFMEMAEEEIIRIQAHESVALSLVKEITEYFHGNSAKEEAHPFRIFMVVRDFLTILDRVCKEVGTMNERTTVNSAHKFPVPVNPTLQPVFRGFPGRRQCSSSDDESSSP